jgi:hypothetical protein
MTTEEMHARMDASMWRTVECEQARHGCAPWPPRPHGTLPKRGKFSRPVSPLRRIRSQLGLSLRDLSNMFGMELTRLWRYENGVSVPKPEIRKRMSESLHAKARIEIQPDDLLP